MINLLKNIKLYKHILMFISMCLYSNTIYANNSPESLHINGIITGFKNLLNNSQSSVKISLSHGGIFNAYIKAPIITKNYTKNGVLISGATIHFSCQNRSTRIALRFSTAYGVTAKIGSHSSLVDVGFYRESSSTKNKYAWVQSLKNEYGALLLSDNPNWLSVLYGKNKLHGAVIDYDGKKMEFVFDTSDVEETIKKHDFFCKDAWLNIKRLD
jgi:hypothetical protein